MTYGNLNCTLSHHYEECSIIKRLSHYLVLARYLVSYGSFQFRLDFKTWIFPSLTDASCVVGTSVFWVDLMYVLMFSLSHVRIPTPHGKLSSMPLWAMHNPQSLYGQYTWLCGWSYAVLVVGLRLWTSADGIIVQFKVCSFQGRRPDASQWPTPLATHILF